MNAPEDFLNSIVPKLEYLLAEQGIPDPDAKDLLQITLLAFLYQYEGIPTRSQESWLLVTLDRHCRLYWRSRRPA